MLDLNDPVEAAYSRMAILKSIVAAERSSAERNPYSERNIELGITEEDQPRGDVKAHIEHLFNELAILLDHLTLLHMTASFEKAAKARIDDAARAARSTLEEARPAQHRWHINLVRDDAKRLKGLQEIGQILGLSGTGARIFEAISSARNRVAHGISLDTGLPLAAEEVRAMLVETLARMT